MCRLECPLWLSDSELEDILEPPVLSNQRRALVRALAAEVWHSPVRLETSSGAKPDVGIRVAARTAACRSGCIASTVMFGLEGPLRCRDSALRTVVAAYASGFGQEKWRRTRWFSADRDGEIHELKLQSCAPRRIWFLQEIPVTD